MMTTYAMNRVVETARTLDEKTRRDLTFQDMILVAAGVHSGTGEADLRRRLRAMALSNRMTQKELIDRMRDTSTAWHREVVRLRACVEAAAKIYEDLGQEKIAKDFRSALIRDEI